MNTSQKRPTVGQIVIISMTLNAAGERICQGCGGTSCSGIATILNDEFFICDIGSPPYELLMNCKNKNLLSIIRVWHYAIKQIIL